MRELVRTNDMVLVSAIGALLDGAKIPHVVLDQNMSVLEGSLGILPRRVLVPEDRMPAARRLLQDAGLGHELRPDGGQMTAVTDDAVLDGRLRLKQPAKGHRVGHDAILLAAATAAKKGEHAIDLGAGVGGAGLALASRVGGLRVTLVDIDPALTVLAAENAARNNLADRVRAVTLDVAASARAFATAGLKPGSADRVLMNPPFHDVRRQKPSLQASRRLAHAAPPEVLPGWISAAARLLSARGVLTLIWRADGLNDVLAALNRGFGAVTVLPVHPKPGAPAIRVLVRATRQSRAPLTIYPGLVLADAEGKPAGLADAVLRGKSALPLADL